MVVSFVGLLQWELLNHAFDVMELGEIDGLLAVESVARRPAVDGASFADQGEGVDFDLAHRLCWLALF